MLEKIKDVTAVSLGIVEHGSVTIYAEDSELQFDIEEYNVNGNHGFRVYTAFGTELSSLGIQVDPKSKRVLDETLVDFIWDHYRCLSSMH